MKKIALYLSAMMLGAGALTGCIEVIDPQQDVITSDQAANTPGAFENFVSATTATLAGQFLYYGSSNAYPYDFGYPALMIQRDVMGQDMAINSDASWYQTWYCCGTGLGPGYALCQMPWTIYYGWINDCNTVLGIAGNEPSDEHRTGAGIAHAMRAFYYMDLAQMFAPKTYLLDSQAETVPIVTEDKSVDLTHNPRATNEVMWDFILSDLDKAEAYLADYKRSDVYTPDISVVCGLKARAYLIMGRYADAVTYARKAYAGYSLLTEAQYTDRNTGFNTPSSNNSWMFATQFRSTDPCITLNDADSSWGSIMSIEIVPSVGGSEGGCGYASNYGVPMRIDRHLYETIPATDFRKRCFLDFAIDELESDEEVLAALAAYSDYPQSVYETAYVSSDAKEAGGISLKFRLNGGDEGHNNQYVGFLQSIPLMRVEEMYLIEAEALGMQAGHESEGIAALTTFARSRDPQYIYGTHNEAYYNTSTSVFQNECWWQRRVEFWGEGIATLDIKRLNKGIIRSYADTNHVADYRWNVESVPQWMIYCIVQTETNNNYDCTNNPTPLAPTQDSPEYAF